MKAVLKYVLISSFVFYVVSCKHHKDVTATTKDSVVESKHETEAKSKSIKKTYAGKLGVSESDIKNEKLYQFIDEWYGVKYKYAGKDKSGIDCSGLTSTLYAKVYKKTISCSTKALVEETKKVKESDMKEGDLVFFKIDSGKASHVGVYLQNNKFVHASTKKGVMISDLNEPYFKKSFLSAGRVK